MTDNLMENVCWIGKPIDTIKLDNAILKARLERCAAMVQAQYRGAKLRVCETKRQCRGKTFASEFRVYYLFRAGSVEVRGCYAIWTIHRTQDVLVLLKHYLLRLLYGLVQKGLPDDN